LIWLGRPDPCETTAKIREIDPSRAILAAVHAAWEQHLECDKAYTTAQLIHQAFSIQALGDALRAAAANARGELSSIGLGRWLAKVKDRIAGTTAIRCHSLTHGMTYWKLTKITPPSRPTWVGDE